MWEGSDGIASIELLNTMGDDLMVVNAARVSFAKESTEMTTGVAKLVKYLAVHNHVTPFFHPQLQFRIKMPIFVAREWYRHQIGFARNEVSRRYVDSEVECYIPHENNIRERNPSLKQGSKDTPTEAADLCREIMIASTDAALDAYRNLLEKKVAPEVARMVLPQSMYTEFIETGSLAAYARLYKLRYSPDAQKEIRDYATALGEIIASKFPVSWKALTSESS